VLPLDFFFPFLPFQCYFKIRCPSRDYIHFIFRLKKIYI
jgi:hypothetical protein